MFRFISTPTTRFKPKKANKERYNCWYCWGLVLPLIPVLRVLFFSWSLSYNRSFTTTCTGYSCVTKTLQKHFTRWPPSFPLSHVDHETTLLLPGTAAAGSLDFISTTLGFINILC